MNEHELRINILQLFLKNGIKSLTMDDIARELSISKKTLYQYFESKDDLVKKCVETFIETDKCKINEFFLKKGNAIDEMFNINKQVKMQLSAVHPSVHYDLKKYYPEAHRLFDAYKHNDVYNIILSNIKKGITEGLYLENINAEIIARAYVLRLDVMFVISEFSKYSFSEVYQELFNYHIRGIATAKGQRYLNKLLNKNQEKI